MLNGEWKASGSNGYTRCVQVVTLFDILSGERLGRRTVRSRENSNTVTMVSEEKRN